MSAPLLSIGYALKSDNRWILCLGLKGTVLLYSVVFVILGRGSTVSLAQDREANRTALAGQVELARLIDLCAERLDLKIEYDANALKGTVTLRLGEGLTDPELWALTNRILATRGFATIRLNGELQHVLSIVKLADAPSLARIEADDARDLRSGYVNAVVRIEHQPVKTIADAVKLVLSKPGGTVSDLGSGGLIVISDLRPRVDDAIKLMDMLDVASAQPLLERIEAHHVGATKLATLITAAASASDAMVEKPHKGKVLPAVEDDVLVLICPPEEADFWRGLVQRFDQRQSVVSQNYSARSFGTQEIARLIEQTARDHSPRGSADQWRLVADDLTGTIIVSATPAEHERIESLMERLNAMPAVSRRPVRTFAIRNRPVLELMDVLTQLMDSGALEGVDSGGVDQSVGSGRSPVEAAVVQPKVVEPTGATTTRSTLPVGTTPVLNGLSNENEKASFSRVDAAGSASAGIKNAISRALTLTSDEGTNTLIAIGESRLLGQLEQLIRTLDVRQPQVMIEVLIVNLSEADTLDLGVELKKIEINGNTTISLSSLFGLGTPGRGVPSEIPGGRGFTGVVLSPGDFSVVLRALQTLNRGRTMSLPKVLVNNNQQATLNSVLQQPFVSVNASDTVATTSFGGTENAGTVITIKPQIAEGDHLVLEYTISLSSFVGESIDPTLPPPKQTNNLSSLVTIPDGYTIVVGGLEITNEADAVSQIPLVGDIPWIGEAFKNRSRNNSRSRFYVFIRSDVMRHTGFEDLKYLSDQDAIAAELTDEFQGWPEVEPRIIR